MDTTEPNITFDENGICNHCKTYFVKEKSYLRPRDELKRLVDKIKRRRKSEEYDCLLGISGGTDSSYAAYLAEKLGLRVLLLHVDNGWNTEAAEHNVGAIVENTGFDFLRFRVDEEELHDLQRAYLKASVMNVEVVTDHASWAAVYRTASKNGIEYVLSGSNFVTEGILPRSWSYRHSDLTNLKNIHKRFGQVRLKHFPQLGVFDLAFHRSLKRIRFIFPLNYVDYNRAGSKSILSKEWGWKDYGLKHYECRCTKFFQAYILPAKFGVDKRKAHFSSLICSGQITRDEAVKLLQRPLYTEEEYLEDREFYLNKLGLSDEEFDELMKLPVRRHEEYGTDQWLHHPLRFLGHTKRKVLSLVTKLIG